MNIFDLLYYFPKYHHDFSKIVGSDQLNFDYPQTIKGSIKGFRNVKLKGRNKTMQKAWFEDENGRVELTWFNQPFIENTLAKSNTFLVAAKLDTKSLKPQCLSPEIEPFWEGNESLNIGRITPVYKLTEGIKQKWLRHKIKWICDYIDYIVDIEDEIFDTIGDKFKLIAIKQALKQIHFPGSNNELLDAKKRIGFDEMLSIQLRVEKNKIIRKRSFSNPIKYKFALSLLDKFKNILPFELTDGQLSTIEEIIEDFKQHYPMRRLVQGDVGSGKTLVAIFAAILIATRGENVIVMAPTSILAKQLFNEFEKYRESFDLKMELVTQDTQKRQNTTLKIELDSSNNQTNACKMGNILIGTHSLLYLEETKTTNLGLVIIDEQHRFGVEQRSQLLQGMNSSIANKPNYLVMSATPIPRTIAQTLFGDMDRSIIRDKPKNRLAVKTFLTPEAKRMSSYKWISERIDEGNQIFWVCPLIEESEVLATKSVNETYKSVKTSFPNHKVEYLTGAHKEIDKMKIIQEFKDHKFDILVSTSLIEVGIDIPNANIIVIEGSERFGLAQLHQLRGRVGRSINQGYCLLYITNEEICSTDVLGRLKFFAKETDGFKVAEFDLKRRGPGEVYGTKQSGIPNLKIASIFDDKLIEDTKKAAQILLNLNKE